MKIVLSLLALLVTFSSYADDITGKWVLQKTIALFDSETLDYYDAELDSPVKYVLEFNANYKYRDVMTISDSHNQIRICDGDYSISKITSKTAYFNTPSTLSQISTFPLDAGCNHFDHAKIDLVNDLLMITIDSAGNRTDFIQIYKRLP